ncbi:MAG: PilN domain-containing protein [Planctomycetes bacterium]|nr:PilN domain-containing protein [Planctomycetota bacterium]
MVTANLLPRARREALARRDRAVLWSWVVVVYTGLLVFLFLASRQYVAHGRSTLERRAAAIESEVAGLQSTLTGLREKSGKTQSLLATARSIADHPDWSVLLSLVASIRGNDIEVERVALGPRKAPETKPGTPAKQPKGVWVRLSGLAKDHQAIAQFALRLEGAGLFDRVSLADARKSGSEPEGFVGFEIEAQIDEQQGGAK